MSELRRVVAVMARSPFADPGVVKTRLAGVVPRVEDRLDLYRAFLLDTLAVCRRVSGASLRVAVTPPGSGPDFARLGLGPGELVEQRGESLGEREQHVFLDLFEAGADAVVLVGSDLPTLPQTHLDAALTHLEQAPDAVVLGPSEDGGYYLIGLGRRPGPVDVPDLFSGVRWSTRFAFDDTVAAAVRAGRAVRLVAPWYDVDDENGFERLRQALADRDQRERAPETTAVLARLVDSSSTV